MNLAHRTIWLLLDSLAALVPVLLLGAATGVTADPTNAAPALARGYIEKFEVPERDENGDLKWKLMGEKALIGTDGLLQVINLRAEFYASNQVEMVFSSPRCTVDQLHQRAATDAPVRIERPNLVVTGDGADWTGSSNSFVVRRNVRVVIGPGPERAVTRLLALIGGGLALALGVWAESGKTNLPAPTAAVATNPPVLAPTPPAAVATNPPAPPPRREPTVVTSERLNVDYLHNVGTFEGNVLAVDPQITVRADKMVVFFGINTNQTAGSNTTARSLEHIIADGGVVINLQDKKARSEHAVYTAADGKAVLTGNPQVEGPEGTVTGDKITFWRDQKKMDVESGTRLILYPDEQKKPPVTPQEPPP